MPQILRPEMALARGLRRSMSYPEVMLWQRLRGQAMGLKFRKQHPIGPYVVDFCCLAARLGVEVDGAGHEGERIDRDRSRDYFIREDGFRALRVREGDMTRDIDAVVAAIVSRAETPHHAAHGLPPCAREDS